MADDFRCLSLTAARFFGGPERQMLGLALAARGQYHTVIASFSEGGLCRDFLARVGSAGIESLELKHDTPNLWRARAELIEHLKTRRIDVLFVHGYKAGLVGWMAARRIGIPVVAVSRGWTRENLKVRMYEWLDRKMLRRMGRVVCVSKSQAEKVRNCNVPEDRIVVIPNAIDARRFAHVDPAGRDELLAMFPEPRPRFLIGAAGRLSPEKGFDLLIETAAQVLVTHPEVGFVLFGDGPLRDQLQHQVERTNLRLATAGTIATCRRTPLPNAHRPDSTTAPTTSPDAIPPLRNRFLLPGFRADLDRFLPHLDLFVQSSHTEGMPNVILEAIAAAVPVVATDVGGTRELMEGVASCQLVESNSVVEMSSAIHQFVSRHSLAREGVGRAKSGLGDRFSFEAQASDYLALICQLTDPPNIHDSRRRADPHGAPQTNLSRFAARHIKS